MNQVVPIADARPAPMIAGGRVQAIVPQSMEEAYRLAVAVCKAGMAPKGLDTPEKAMIAIMHGLEIGLTPMSALQRIAVVNGRPTIWGDAAIGLVRGSGLCEFVKEEIVGEGDKRAGKCAAKRKGEPEPVVRTFSVSDAKRAGLWDKAGPWKQFPDRMLQLRARAFALRDGFADVLGGLYLREEVEEGPMRDVTPPSPPRPPSPPAIAAPEPTPAHDPATGEIQEEATPTLPPAESAKLKSIMLAKLAAFTTSHEIDEWSTGIEDGLAALLPTDREEVRREWDARLAEFFERERTADAD